MLLSRGDRVEYLKGVLGALPRGFKSAVKQLLPLLHHVHQHSGVNQMSAQRLAPLFASIFLRPLEMTYYMTSDERDRIEITQLLIEECEILIRQVTNYPILLTLSYHSFTRSLTHLIGGGWLPRDQRYFLVEYQD